MARLCPVLTINVEDHVSPILKAFDSMHLMMPVNAALPPLPDDLLAISTTQRTSMVSIAMRPSPSMLDWLAAVRKLSTR